jgi:hypothetical protein
MMMARAREVILVSKCGNHVTARAREVRVTMMMKKTVTHFVSLALHRFTVLCSGKGDDDGKGKDGSGEGNDNGKKEKEDGSGKGDDNDDGNDNNGIMGREVRETGLY